MNKLSTNARNRYFALTPGLRMMVLFTLLSTLALFTMACSCGDGPTGSTQMQHSETIVTNDDGSTSWHVQNEPVHEPTVAPITAPCISCVINANQGNTGPAINVGGGAPVPNASACQANPTLVGCPSVPR